MPEEAAAQTALPVLLTTQLMAAEVYARFLSMGGEDEKELWRNMLAEEVDHVAYLRDAMTITLPEDLTLPFVNADRMNGVCERVKLQGMDSFILRLEGALRLECAELDYGFEGLAAKRFAKRGDGIQVPRRSRQTSGRPDCSGQTLSGVAKHRAPNNPPRGALRRQRFGHHHHHARVAPTIALA